MKAIIDIGSNSVRLAIFADGQIIYKGKITSQLGKGLALTGKIAPEQMKKTVDAVRTFVVKSMLFGVERKDIRPFATATVRRAENADEFLKAVYDDFGVFIDVVSEHEEASLALIGCFGSGDGAVLDIGGASSELIIKEGGDVKYKYSLPLGAVVLTDLFGNDREKMDEYVKERIKEYGQVPEIKTLHCVGGTSSCCARVLARAREYDPEKTDGKTVIISDLNLLVDRFFTLNDEQKEKMGVEAPRTGIIAGGTLLLINILGYLGLDRFIASENDNLTGYYLLKCAGEENG